MATPAYILGDKERLSILSPSIDAGGVKQLATELAAVALADALAVNKTSERLDLRYNEI
jgi:hypothetical protein